MTENEFITLLEKQNIILTPKMVEDFRCYFELLNEYNKVMNLTAIDSKEEVYDRHFYNSLTIAFNKDFNNLSICDVGAGAGFPSIPLKIVFPNSKITIIDPLSKRMDFIKEVIKELELKDINILYLRAEDASKKYKEVFDIVTARAVAPLNILVEITSQLIKINGYLIAMKGQKGNEELQNAKKALETCNLSLENTNCVGKSINFYFKKTKTIDNKYPRNYGQIKRRPL